MEYVSAVWPRLLVMPHGCVQRAAEYLGPLSFYPGALNFLFCLAHCNGEKRSRGLWHPVAFSIFLLKTI